MGTEVTPQRKIMFIEELDFRSAITEFTAAKQAAVTNFISKFHCEAKNWCLNGTYTGVVFNGFDGHWTIPFDMEILFFSMSNVVSGSSGTTEADLELFTSPGVSAGSIFTTTPKIDSNASDDTWIFKDILTPANDINPVGTTLPVFSTNLFNQGESLKFNLLSSMIEPETMNVNIYFRPR